MFKDGKARVDLFSASAMVAVYNALKPASKKKFEEMIKSKEGFIKTQEFAMKMAKEEVDLEALFKEEVEIEEGTALQVRMALDDVGLKGKWKNNKVYVKKKDVEKAKKALKGNVIYKGKFQ